MGVKITSRFRPMKGVTQEELSVKYRNGATKIAAEQYLNIAEYIFEHFACGECFRVRELVERIPCIKCYATSTQTEVIQICCRDMANKSSARNPLIKKQGHLWQVV